MALARRNKVVRRLKAGPEGLIGLGFRVQGSTLQGFKVEWSRAGFPAVF